MPTVGDTLGRYTLLKRLAAGGMGEIFLAARAGPLGFAPPIALKVLKQELAGDSQFVDMLVDEAKISMFLNHQNVVSCLDFGEDAGTYYIAMEYVQGTSLQGLHEALKARGRRLEIPLALYAAVELCKALKYAHTRANHAGEPLSIVHRDVTPGNVLLSIHGDVKLTDFGIARAKGRIHNTQAGVLKGKFGYMAPEMFRYEKIDARADIFCVGVLVYVLVAGQHPVEGASIMEAIERFDQKNIPPPSSINPEVPKALDAILMKALEPRPDDRWPNAAALGAAFQELALETAAIRREMKSPAQRLSDLIAEVVPECVENPLPQEVTDRLLEEARSKEAKAKSDLDGVGGIGRVSGDGDSTPVEQAPSNGRALVEPVIERRTSGRGVLLPLVDPAERDTRESLPSQDDLPALSDDFGGTYRELDDTHLPKPRARAESVRRGPRKGGTLESLPDLRQEPDTGEMATAAVNLAGDDDSDLEAGPTTIRPQSDATAGFAAIIPPSDSGVEVRFPDSSTDRSRLHLLDEPEREPPAGGDATIPVGALSKKDLEAARRAQALLNAQGNDDGDGKTIAMGMAVPEWRDRSSSPPAPSIIDQPTAEERPVFEEFERPVLAQKKNDKPAFDDYATSFGAPPLEDEDAVTIIPDRTGSNDISDMARAIRDEAEEEEQPGGDRTLLDGIDAKSVKSALARERAQKKSAFDEGELPDRGEKPMEDLDDRTVARVVLGPSDLASGGGSASLRSKDAPEVSSGSGEIQKSAQKISGPLRIRVGEDGNAAMVNNAAAAPHGHGQGHGAGLPAPAARKPTTAKPAPATTSKPPAPSWGGSAMVLPAAGGTAPAKPSGPDQEGADTGKWMKGQVSADKLSWDDDDAARRLIETRNAAPAGTRSPAPPASPAPTVGSARGVPVVTPSPAAVVPNAPAGQRGTATSQPVYGIPQIQHAPEKTSVKTIVLIALAVVAVAGVVSVVFFTKALWPTLKLESEPAKASVSIDGKLLPVATPLEVKVKPFTPHKIEFTLDGYKPKVLDGQVNVGYFETAAYSVQLERFKRVVHAPLSVQVYAEDKLVGEGRDVELPDLDPRAPVILRVEAPGFKTWSMSFNTGADVPSSIDVPLQKQEEPPPPPPPPGPIKK